MLFFDWQFLGEAAMKKLRLVLAAVFAFVLTVHSSPLMAQTANSSDKTDQQLAKENAALRQQVAELRNRIRHLEAKTSLQRPVSGTSAMAADLPVKAPVYRAPVVAPFNWTGLYGGIHVGYGWSNSTAIEADYPPLSPPLDQNSSGVIGGGQIGYNWQIARNWVVGIEGDFSGTGIHKTTIEPWITNGVPVFFLMAERNINWLATLRGRFGYAFDRWLIYATGGGAWGNVTYGAGPFITGGPGAWLKVTSSNTSSGWTIGAGVEYGFTDNWTARLEYLYYNFGGASVTNVAPTVPTATQIWDRNKINVARLGVNYKF
jgi:outer membrane immunogenic protein